MSNSQAYEKVTVRAEGVTVTKRFEEDEFPVPAIAFEFESEREETVRVHLSDRVPEGVAVEDLGFHPEYGSEYWEIQDETISFERELETGTSYTTVYGIRATGADDIEQFLTEPTIEEVDPPLPEAETATAGTDGGNVIPDDDDVVKDVIGGDGEIPGLESEDDSDDEESVETLDLTDPTAPDSDTDETDESGGSASPEVDGVVAALAEEIRSENVAAEDLQLLGRALDHVADSQSGSTDARLRQLQSDIADLRAYTSAIEEFLDEEGTAQQLIDEFESRLRTLDNRLDEVESQVGDNTERLGDMDGTVTDVREEIDATSTTVEDLEATVTEFNSEIETLREDLDATESTVEEVSSDVDSARATLADVETAVEDLETLESTVSDIDSELDDLRATVADVETEVAETDELTDRIDSIESSIDDLQDWQEQIKQTFGG